jgi:hypothetical protein
MNFILFWVSGISITTGCHRSFKQTLLLNFSYSSSVPWLFKEVSCDGPSTIEKSTSLQMPLTEKWI